MRKMRLTGRTIKMIKIGGKMKRVHLLLLAMCFLVLNGLLFGCGSGPGAPGSHGSEKTGVILDVASITPTYNEVNTYSVDAFQQICQVGPPEIDEIFSDHSAIITFNARLLNPNATFTPGALHITKYTVEYRRSTDSIGAPPIEKIIDGTVGMPVTIYPPSGTDTTAVITTVVFVDLKRKDQYRADIESGMYTPNILNNYTALYTFEGQNDFGEYFSIQAQAVGFQIANFNNCGG
jgi:hypothetical protein